METHFKKTTQLDFDICKECFEKNKQGKWWYQIDNKDASYTQEFVKIDLIKNIPKL